MTGKTITAHGAKRGTLLALLSAVLLLSGCATEAMKSTPFYEGNDVAYTGKSEDRVNLWPLAYWREPVGSVLWPFVSFSDDHFAVRPFYSRYGSEQSILWPLVSFSDDHFAVRPFYSRHGSEHDFLWPLGKYNDKSGEGRFFPVFFNESYLHVFPLVYYKTDDYFTLFPFVWWDIDGKEFTLFPIFGHTKEHDWLFPLFYRDNLVTFVTPFVCVGRHHEWDDDDFFWVFPFCYHDKYLTWATPFAGWSSNGDAHWLLPFYASYAGAVFSPLWCSLGGDEPSWVCPPLLSWSEKSAGGAYENRYLLGLAGSSGKADGYSRSWLAPLYYGDSDGAFVTPLYGQTKDAWWVFPLFYKDDDEFHSWLWSQKWNDNGELAEWLVPPLLTSYWQNEDGSGLGILGALAGASWNGPDGQRSSWCLPLWYEDSDGSLITPLYGQIGWKGEIESRWLLPLFYKDARDFVSPLWWQSFRYDTGETESWMIPPLFTGGGFERDGKSYFYFPLGGYDDKRSGVFPLWYKNESGLYTLPFCHWWDEYKSMTFVPWLLSWREASASKASTRLLLGLYGHDSDSEGAREDWLFPLWSWKRGEYFSLLMRLACWTDDDSSWIIPFYGYDASNHDLLTPLFGRLSRHGSKRYYFLTPILGFSTGSEKGFWCWPLFDWFEEADRNISESSALLGLLWSSREEKVVGGRVKKTRSLLWRLYHYDELDGDATTDIFPFITHDTKKDGHVKTSFLWRFFRWEADPKGGTDVDLLFIPVWRSSWFD